MKKFNVNIIVFACAALFVVCGFTKSYANKMFDFAKTFVSEAKQTGIADAFYNLTKSVDAASGEALSYRGALMEINAAKNSVINTRVIQKDDTTVVKTDNGSLIEPQEYIDDAELDASVKNLSGLYNKTKESGAEFMYIAALAKGCDFDIPENVTDYRTANLDRYVKKISDAGIPLLNLTQELKAKNCYSEELFYLTDHHWTARTGFWATEQIVNRLNTDYGFEYNSEYTDLENYNIKTYNDWFLGSYGKKTGRLFLKDGADDFELITPRFETSLTEEQPYKNQVRSGDFTSSVLYMENIEQKDYYVKNPYATYSGGDFRLQIIKNNLNPNGKKMLIVRDSMACAVTPFLALNFSELHIVDIRDYEYFVGERINVYDYIDKTAPDYVTVLYMGAGGYSSGKFNFN